MELRPYQRDGVAWWDKLPRGGILADEMGLGKTIQALLASRGRTLIVAPAIVVDGGVWQDEIERWDLDPSRFTITTYHSLPGRERTERGHRPTTRPRPKFRGPWDDVILDECHNIKERKTTWTQALTRVRTQRYLMTTGTPVPNWAHEIYVPLRLLQPRDPDFSSYWRWIHMHFKVHETPFTKWHIGGLHDCTRRCKRDERGFCDHWRTFVEANHLDRLMLRRYRDEVATDLPPLTTQDVFVDMGPKQARAYRNMKRTFIADVEDQRIEAWSEAAAFMALLRLSTGLAAIDPDLAGPKRGSAKLDWVREAMIQRSTQGTVFFGVWRNTIHAMAKLARELQIPHGVITGETPRPERRMVLQMFQAGKFPFLIGTCQTIGEGIQLTAADGAVFAEHPWRPSLVDQCIRRIHRLGQTRPCHVWHLWTRGTLDDGVRTTLARKEDQQVRMLTAQQVASLA